MIRNILIVEDDADVAMLERDYLEIAGFGTRIISDGAAAVSAALSGEYDLILLDLVLPNCSGYEVCRRIRDKLKIPILMVSAHGDLVDKVRGLGLGADDYITKPFLPQELLLRLGAVLRRVYGGRQEDVLTLGPATVHWGTSRVTRPEGEVSLTAKEFALLKKLADNRGNIVTIDALCAALWEGPMVGYENTLMVHIRRLREKIEADPSHPRYLLTVRGLGYRLAREDRA